MTSARSSTAAQRPWSLDWILGSSRTASRPIELEDSALTGVHINIECKVSSPSSEHNNAALNRLQTIGCLQEQSTESGQFSEAESQEVRDVLIDWLPANATSCIPPLASPFANPDDCLWTPSSSAASSQCGAYSVNGRPTRHSRSSSASSLDSVTTSSTGDFNCCVDTNDEQSPIDSPSEPSINSHSDSGVADTDADTKESPVVLLPSIASLSVSFASTLLHHHGCAAGNPSTADSSHHQQQQADFSFATTTTTSAPPRQRHSAVTVAAPVSAGHDGGPCCSSPPSTAAEPSTAAAPATTAALPPHYQSFYEAARAEMGADYTQACVYAEYWSALTTAMERRGGQTAPASAGGVGAPDGEAAAPAEAEPSEEREEEDGLRERAEAAEGAAAVLAERLHEARSALALCGVELAAASVAAAQAEAQAQRESAAAAATARRLGRAVRQLERERVQRAALERQLAAAEADNAALQQQLSALRQVAQEAAAAEATEAPAAAAVPVPAVQQTAVVPSSSERQAPSSASTGGAEVTPGVEVVPRKAAPSGSGSWCESESESESKSDEIGRLRREVELLLVCLGQEASKAAALAGALRGAGGDPDELVRTLEERWA